MEREELQRRKELILSLMSDKIYSPMKIKEMAIILGVEKQDRQGLLDILEELIKERKIQLSSKGKYSLVKDKELEGVYMANQRGFGFVRVEGIEEDFFIPEGRQKDALHGDNVIIVTDESKIGKRTQAYVKEVTKHVNTQIIGILKKSKSFGFVVPDNRKILKDIFIPKEKIKDIKNNSKVLVNIYDFGNINKKPEGEIMEVLGVVGEKGVDILSILKSYSLEEEFNEQVQKELELIPDSVEEKETVGRRDLRNIQTVTIDGADAKDLDDAISLSYDGVWHLGVHIADVSHYVKENSALDTEALKRGTSVYLVDRVIPMLPKKLSNGICSLNEKVDRLSLSCLIDIDDEGKIINHEIVESVINVDRRMTYEVVNSILTEEASEYIDSYKEFLVLFNNMKELSALIRKKRDDRGAINFDLPESKVILDDKGRAADIKPYDRNVATRIIEDFMLIANETVAEDYFWQEIPFLYRIHEKPEDEKMKKLSIFINNFGYTMRNKGNEFHPKEIQKLLRKLEGSPEEALISRIVLKNMQKARYQTENIGHFGLAAKYYSHFTSPIRRYPDLQIHRIIKENIKNGISDLRFERYNKILDEVAKQSSDREKIAWEAERESVKYKKCEYMLRHIGDIYEGVISSVTEYGVYVELPNTVEGFIRISDFDDDYYRFNKDGFELIGDITNKRYRLGESIRIRVFDVDKMNKTIDFIPVKNMQEIDGD